ncbi:MAG TPA: UvrD-helicase domain-containing protein [Micromonosporaceae bacterium]|nr:UvrD-helicase domain-containing protein [Micromonosporaceae bacterium]
MTGTLPARPVALAGPRFTPAEVAALLRLPRPTEEQARIICAPVAPLLVVAGAGSGKTETMAARVVWLVANGYVRPEQVLGLTFTRKAAGELAHRIRVRLGQLVRRLGRDEMLTGEPTVATYHSYAARIVTEHGLRCGFEPSVRLLTEAACWQLADAVVRGYDGDMSDVDAAVSTVTDAVLHLAAELAEHLRTPQELAAWTGRFHAQVQGRPGRVYADVRTLLDRQRARLALLPIVRAYGERKRLLEAMDFGDQLARAARVAGDHPEVGAIERDRSRVVLLDEYQDTSHAQVVLLRALFGGGHPVTAVGDPCQSIYGWRGASAGTLRRFPVDFPLASGAAARVATLSTSWRNRAEILDVANALSGPLREAGAQVARLVPAARVARPVGSARTVHCALLRTYRDEAAWVAGRIARAWREEAGVEPGAPIAEIPPARRPTTAVLVRTRKQIATIAAALRTQGLPVEVVGLGGLLDTPEVRDVVATMQVLADPAQGAALLRLLTGPRWRIGPRDLVALHRRAKVLARERAGQREREVVVDRLDEATLVEALDDLGAPEQYSPRAYRRFGALRDELRALRTRLDQPLPDLVADIERVTGLEVEVATRAGDAGLARGHLDALGAVAARFSTESEGGTVSAFLAFLAAAEDEERGLAPGEVEVVEGAVQVLTAHAAKGLEWDVVAVAGLTGREWPATGTGSDHWLRGLGVLPFPLRGDAAELPALDLAGAADQRAVNQARTAFEERWREHDGREERRLAYVAVTRARRLLLCSGYWWAEGVLRPRGPSPFLREIHQRCRAGAGAVDGWADPPAEDEANPTAAHLARAVWPGDPLGERRGAVAEGAALVRAALAGRHPPGADDAPPTGDASLAEDALPAEDASLAEDGSSDDGASSDDGVSSADDRLARWAYEVDLLLAERARRRAGDGVLSVTLPAHLSVSQLVTLRRDPQALARTLRRPLPAAPDPHARRGTAFHRWLEQRFGADQLLDIDELPGAADEDAAPDAVLVELQERFLASEWADRTPVRTEVPFATVVAGTVLRGRIDAVFADPAGGYDVVDWKTGRPPAGPAAEAAAVQLAAYRLAWAALAGVPVEQVRAAFHYVREGVTVRPADLLDEAGLAALVMALPEGDQ